MPPQQSTLIGLHQTWAVLSPKGRFKCKLNNGLLWVCLGNDGNWYKSDVMGPHYWQRLTTDEAQAASLPVRINFSPIEFGQKLDPGGRKNVTLWEQDFFIIPTLEKTGGIPTAYYISSQAGPGYWLKLPPGDYHELSETDLVAEIVAQFLNTQEGITAMRVPVEA